ncbi:MAG: hypothetical protein JNM93_12225 [Bacteriovoracaceae bacterium]|nr:hypothetical protein [Bacteriovoracaceae bacterium]
MTSSNNQVPHLSFFKRLGLSYKLRPYLVGSSEVLAEFKALKSSKYFFDLIDNDELYYDVSNADLMVILGSVTLKSLNVILRAYEQLPQPKLVIWFESAELHLLNQHSMVVDLEKHMKINLKVNTSVDSPEDIMDAFIKLREQL